ncbi:MAG TPA: four helix bundle protein [Candidatus Onthomorpha intestinigallinarum]|uniref:Four helix bundle protein n=1 Tax=Candidatus Onthomorpha intestinigallinarum TaxID=2840880 RepID=A0A9D1RIF9_9BACT|nr:four helix bundle protein [Candidatus Onthomorpha intestinigallinarum]
MDSQVKTVSFFRFEDLRIYHKSLDYFNWIVQQSGSVSERDFNLVIKPLADAAAGVSKSIAEGSARHKAQFVQFLKNAKSSVRSCVVYSTLALKCGAFTQEQYDKSNETLVEMTKMIGAMIVSLQRNAERKHTEDNSKGLDDMPDFGEESTDNETDLSKLYF